MGNGQVTVRDRLWLWGMPVNALQKTDHFGRLGWSESKISVAKVMARTGISNVYLAGGFEINEESLAAMPDAKRIICKWSIHRHVGDGIVIDYEACEERLLAAKRLAKYETRIEGFLLDDFSTGAMESGVTTSDLARLQFSNAVHAPALPLLGTIYHMSLERPGLSDFLRYFDQLVVPLWHVVETAEFPSLLARCAELSGNKPTIACLYFYDFGAESYLTREQMKAQLAMIEPLLLSGKIAGLLFCGTCVLDLDWESVSYFHDWVAEVGGQPLAT